MNKETFSFILIGDSVSKEGSGVRDILIFFFSIFFGLFSFLYFFLPFLFIFWEGTSSQKYLGDMAAPSPLH